MPIPKPEGGETESQFVSRCISKIIDEYDQSQAAAICYNSYRTKEEMSKKDAIFVLQPKKTENRGQYLSRCSNNSKMKQQYPVMKKRLGFCLNSFNEYYRYWSKLEFEEVPENSALGNCIAKQKSKGFDYKEAYARCASKVVVPNVPVVMEDNLLVVPVEFAELDILGYKTKYFYICPGAVSTFEHLISMNPDEDTARMIRNAAVIADKVFEIEAKVLDEETASTEQLDKASLLVDDFYELMEVIDDRLGMIHDVSYMDGHLEKIASYINNKFATIGPRGGIKESDKAPKSDTPNKDPEGKGTAKGDASGKRGAKVTAEQEKTLQKKVDDFNERDSNTKYGRATLGALKSVFQRGLGAYNTSHSPNVSSSEQWAYARVNAFLYLLKNGRPENKKYDTDFDLLPTNHPKYPK